jgi:hypothetical protein
MITVTLAIRTRDLLLLGLTRASIRPECVCVYLTVLLLAQSTTRKTVFIIGPSHHVYLDGCALSKCTSYETPIGPLPLDLDSE